jgi:hypothetical protein
MDSILFVQLQHRILIVREECEKPAELQLGVKVPAVTRMLVPAGWRGSTEKDRPPGQSAIRESSESRICLSMSPIRRSTSCSVSSDLCRSARSSTTSSVGHTYASMTCRAPPQLSSTKKHPLDRQSKNTMVSTTLCRR